MIAPIPSLASIAPAGGIAPVNSSSQSSQFQGILSDAIQSIETQRNHASDAIQKFLTGENEELHTVVLATQKAELAFELGLQVRNKVVDAYQEIMKMQV